MEQGILDWEAAQSSSEGSGVGERSGVRSLHLPGGYEMRRVAVSDGADASRAASVFDVVAVGAGPAAAAAGTATALTAAAVAGGQDAGYGLVVSAGIGGGFLSDLGSAVAGDLHDGLDVGGIADSATGAAGGADSGRPAERSRLCMGGAVVSRKIVAADLGAQTAEGGFLPVTELGFGTSEHHSPDRLAYAVAVATGGVLGDVLTVTTATGTNDRARELTGRHPGAAAEGMEGFGVAEAAAAYEVPVLELRTVSNAVGRRDRGSWAIAGALEGLRGVFRGGAGVLVGWG